MSDTNTPAQAASPEPQAGDGQQMEPEQQHSGQLATQWTPDAAAAEIKALRAEAARYRKEREQAVKAAEQQQAATLAEQGKYKDLYEQTSAKLAELTPLQERMAALTETTTAANARRIEALPVAMRSLVPEYDDPFKVAAWLDANAAILGKSPLPSLDGRAGQGGQPAPVVVTDDEVAAFASKYGLRPQDVDRSLLAKTKR
jgi:hypothetical protein